MLSIAIAVLAAQASAVPAPAPGRQQAFEKAAAAADRQDWSGALAQFEALERQLSSSKASRSRALVRLRKGEALVRLGRIAEAEASIRAGLAELSAGDASLKEDRIYGRLILAEIRESRHDYAGANREYSAVLADAKGTAFEARLQVGAIRSGTFVDPRAAAAAADIMVRSVAGADKPARELRAQWRTLKGRALLNAGEFAGAYAELDRATKELGGLTMRVSYADLVARSDLAIAALLAGKPDRAREFLAYTGAGRTKDGFFALPTRGTPPACGAATGLRTDDVAVVELVLRENGTVAGAAPVYASRPAMAPMFAKAAAQWAWAPESVSKMGPLLRSAIRVEVRCTQVPERSNVFSYLEDAHDIWTASADPSLTPEMLTVMPLSDIRARLATLGQGSATAASRLALMKAIAQHPAAEKGERRDLTARAVDVAVAAKAPALVLADTILRRDYDRLSELQADPTEQVKQYRAAFASILANPVVARDARARAAVALLQTNSIADERAHEAALRRIAEDPALPRDDDIRIGAALRLAARMSERDKFDEARALYAGIGLSPERCPVLDIARGTAKLRAGAGDFPNEAMAWGFEGWAETEVLIANDGRATGARTLIAYPPFVFGKAAATVVISSRYQPSFRPQSEARCGGQTQRVSFRLPE